MIRGHIVLWSKTINLIPAGWQLCDGTNGTPDLRDRFVVGAGSTYAVDATGGSVNHSHTFTSDTHRHGQGPDDPPGFAAGVFKTSAEVVTGATDGADGRPPYYALAYIMKM